MDWYREFIEFLDQVEVEVPAGPDIDAILNNYAAHKHGAVTEWLAELFPLSLPLHGDLLRLDKRGRGLLREVGRLRKPLAFWVWRRFMGIVSIGGWNVEAAKLLGS